MDETRSTPRPARAGAAPVRNGGRRPAACLLAAMLLAACATPNLTKIEDGGLPRPGAKIVIDSVSNAGVQSPVPDIDERLRAALVTALQDEQMLAQAPPDARDLHLSLKIFRYEPGNAVKRWLMPGAGRTVLGVRGEVRDSSNGRKVASIDYTHTVSIGGLYTIGAWSQIFTTVASDVAKDLKRRVNKGDDPEVGGAARSVQDEGDSLRATAESANRDIAHFVVTVAPRAERAGATPPPPGLDSPRVALAALDDQRLELDRIGERSAAFGLPMGDVFASRDVPDYFREALIDELRRHGRMVSTDGSEDLVVTPRLKKFWVATDATALYWDINAEVECELEFRGRTQATPVSSHFLGRATQRTYLYPSRNLMSETLNSALDDLFAQIASDPAWNRFAAR